MRRPTNYKRQAQTSREDKYARIFVPYDFSGDPPRPPRSRDVLKDGTANEVEAIARRYDCGVKR